jgi:hypothetical protein
MFHTKFGLPHPLILKVTHYICAYLLDPTGTHFHTCSHGGERITSNDVVRNVFASTTKDKWFHVSYEKTHVLSPLSLQSSHQQVDIVLSTNGIHTLVNMVIDDPTRGDLVSQVVPFRKVIMMMTTQAKEGLYHDWHSTNMFLPLAIEIFECIHQQANNFLHQCVNMV